MNAKYKNEDEIRNDPAIKNQYQLTGAIETFRRENEAQNAVNASRTISPEQAVELRKLAADIATAEKSIAAFDRSGGEQQKLLDDTRQKVKRLETPDTLPDDATLLELIKERTRVELLVNFLATAAARRGFLVSVFRSRISALGAKLRAATGRTMLEFQNPNLGLSDAAHSARAEVERVIKGEASAFETIPNRPPLIVMENCRA